MVKLVILFKQATNTALFRQQYAANLSLLKKMPDLRSYREGKVVGSPSGQPAYHHILELFFDDFDALDAALTSPEGVRAGKDLIGFAGTDAELLFIEEGKDIPKPLTPNNLQAYLDSFDIPAEIVFPGKPTPTVPAAAKALGVEPEQIVKSMVFLVDGRPFLVYGCGTRRVNPTKLAERLNVSRRTIKLANADEVLDITGYAAGTVPPLGLKTRMPVFMDPAVQEQEVIYAGGGGNDTLLKITSADLLRVSEAEIAPMLYDPKPQVNRDEIEPLEDESSEESEAVESDSETEG